MKGRIKVMTLFLVVGIAIFAFSVYSSGMYIGVSSTNSSEHNVLSDSIATGNGFMDVKVGQTNFIGEYIVSKGGYLSNPNIEGSGSNGVNQVSVSKPVIQIFGVKEYHKSGVKLAYSYGKIGNYTMKTLTYTTNTSLFGLKMTDVLINRGSQYGNESLSMMAIAFQPNLGKDLHLGDLLVTNFSSNLKGQILSIQSGIYSLATKYMESGNKTMTTLGIYYLLTAQSLTSFIKLTPVHILKQKIDITGVYLIDGNLAACIAELVSLGIAGAVLVSEASACFTGVGFGIPCALFFITVNALPIVEVIAINYAC